MTAFFTSNRAKSFYWRTSMMVVAGLLSLISTGVTNGELQLPAWAVVLIGLALGEVSKYLNTPPQA